MATAAPASTCDISRIPEYTVTEDTEYCTADFKSKGTAKTPSATSFMDCKQVEKTITGSTASLDCTDMNRQLSLSDEKNTPQEYFGPDSRCFMSSYKSATSSESPAAQLKPRCHRFKCEYSETGVLRLKVLLNNQAVQCPFEGGDVLLAQGTDC